MAHARLSPSASSRWLHCTASVDLIEENFPGDSPPSRASKEGTYAHELAEINISEFYSAELEQHGTDYDKAREDLKASVLTDAFGFNENDWFDMEFYVDKFLLYVQERAESHSGHIQVLAEKRLHTSFDDVWGTSDIVIFGPESIEIIDLKYGMGVPVDAENNTQLRIYGVAAYDNFGNVLGDTETVSMSVFQPRLDSQSTETLTVEELETWASTVLSPKVQDIESGDTEFAPNDSTCMWCPAAGICRARLEQAIAEDFGTPGDFSGLEDEEPSALSPDEIAEVLARAPKIKKFLAELEKTALDLAYQQGVEIPGYKVIRSGGRRGISDGPSAIQALLKAGYDVDSVAKMQPETLGKLEKVVGGRTKLDELIGEYVSVSTGKESLVPEDDKRPSISPLSEAASDFAEND